MPSSRPATAPTLQALIPTAIAISFSRTQTKVLAMRKPSGKLSLPCMENVSLRDQEAVLKHPLGCLFTLQSRYPICRLQINNRVCDLYWCLTTSDELPQWPIEGLPEGLEPVIVEWQTNLKRFGASDRSVLRKMIAGLQRRRGIQ